jgi:hypothetical protein
MGGKRVARPSDLAVLILITNSNLVGWTTGRSAAAIKRAEGTS